MDLCQNLGGTNQISDFKKWVLLSRDYQMDRLKFTWQTIDHAVMYKEKEILNVKNAIQDAINEIVFVKSKKRS